MLTHISGYTYILPTAVLFFFSHVTIPKAQITPSCMKKDERKSLNYSAKELAKERVTVNELTNSVRKQITYVLTWNELNDTKRQLKVSLGNYERRRSRTNEQINNR